MDKCDLILTILIGIMLVRVHVIRAVVYVILLSVPVETCKMNQNKSLPLFSFTEEW